MLTRCIPNKKKNYPPTLYINVENNYFTFHEKLLNMQNFIISGLPTENK